MPLPERYPAEAKSYQTMCCWHGEGQAEVQGALDLGIALGVVLGGSLGRILGVALGKP